MPFPSELLKADHPDSNKYYTRANLYIRDRLQEITDHSHSHDRPYSWGLTIFRTVYTPTSDESFPRAVENFYLLAKQSVLGEPDSWRDHLEYPSNMNLAPNVALAKRFHCDIVQDASALNGAGPDKVGELFDDWIEKHHHDKRWRESVPFGSTLGRFEFCIMLDQQGIDHLAQMRVPLRGDPHTDQLLYVKVVTALKREDLSEEGGQVDGHNAGRLWLRAQLPGMILDLCIGMMDTDFNLDEIGWVDEVDGILNFFTPKMT